MHWDMLALYTPWQLKLIAPSDDVSARIAIVFGKLP